MILRGAPYLPTLKKQTEIALDLLDLKTGQTLIDLGAGDGRVAIAAARRGIRVVGYELNPLLWLIASVRTLRYRDLVTMRLADFWNVKLNSCDGVFIFGIERIMPRLETKLQHELKGGTKVVSFTFRLPNSKEIKNVNGLYLYRF